jgi:hypothetical protein
MASDRDRERDFAKKYGQVVARAWSDPAFKDRLIADPAGTAREYDIHIPPGLDVRILEDTDSVRHIVLPPRPSSQDLSDEQLEHVAGGGVCASTTVKTLPGPLPPPPPPPPPPPTCDDGICWSY